MNESLQAPAPQWVDFGKTSDRGFDLLGLRNPVQKIGTAFLDGITTITPAIRYLSFRSLASYCYAQAHRPDDWMLFRNYAEGIEATIAYGNLLVGVDAKGLLGTDKAKENLNKAADRLILKDLVKQIGVNIYTGVAEQLKISFPTRSGIPGLTRERGVPLALEAVKSFEKSELGRLILTGECPIDATRSQLEEFGGSVQLDSLEPVERSLLVDFLIPAEPSPSELPRVMTYSILLSLAGAFGKSPTENDLFETAVWRKEVLPEIFSEVLDGWLIYLIRDQLAVVHERALKEINSALERKSSQSTNLYPSAEIISEILSQEDEVFAALRRLNLVEKGDSILNLSFREIKARLEARIAHERFSTTGLYRWEAGINELDLIKTASTAESGALAILPISWLLALTRIDLRQINEFPLSLLSHQGWTRLGIKEVISPLVAEFLEKNESFLGVAARIAHLVVDQHLRISWGRFSQDPKKLVATIVSDGVEWAYRKDFSPGRTASRIREAAEWLEQLELIDENGLTSDGQEKLNVSLERFKRGGFKLS